MEWLTSHPFEPIPSKLLYFLSVKIAFGLHQLGCKNLWTQFCVHERSVFLIYKRRKVLWPLKSYRNKATPSPFHTDKTTVPSACLFAQIIFKFCKSKMDGVRTLQKISVSETISSYFEEMTFGKIVQTLLLTGRIALENAWFFKKLFNIILITELQSWR